MNKKTLNRRDYQTTIKAEGNGIRLTNQSDNDSASVSINGGAAIVIQPFPSNKVNFPAARGQLYKVTYNSVPGNPDVLVEW